MSWPVKLHSPGLWRSSWLHWQGPSTPSRCIGHRAQQQLLLGLLSALCRRKNSMPHTAAHVACPKNQTTLLEAPHRIFLQLGQQSQGQRMESHLSLYIFKCS